MPSGETSLPVLSPDLQVAFYYILGSLRKECLAEALRETVAGLRVAEIDRELERCVPPAALQKVASFGLRGEVVFPVPLVLRANPSLLGYYRLLFGLSQKEFYNKGPFGRFKGLEESGQNPPRTDGQLEALCRSLIETAARLVDGLDDLSLPIVHELQLLTLGPQLRGGAEHPDRAGGHQCRLRPHRGHRTALHQGGDKAHAGGRQSGRPNGAGRVRQRPGHPDHGEAPLRRPTGCVGRDQGRRGRIQHPQPPRRSGKEPPEGQGEGFLRVLDHPARRCRGGRSPQRIPHDQPVLPPGRNPAVRHARARSLQGPSLRLSRHLRRGAVPPPVGCVSRGSSEQKAPSAEGGRATWATQAVTGGLLPFGLPSPGR